MQHPRRGRPPRAPLSPTRLQSQRLQLLLIPAADAPVASHGGDMVATPSELRLATGPIDYLRFEKLAAPTGSSAYWLAMNDEDDAGDVVQLQSLQVLGAFEDAFIAKIREAAGQFVYIPLSTWRGHAAPTPAAKAAPAPTVSADGMMMMNLDDLASIVAAEQAAEMAASPCMCPLVHAAYSTRRMGPRPRRRNRPHPVRSQPRPSAPCAGTAHQPRTGVRRHRLRRRSTTGGTPRASRRVVYRTVQTGWAGWYGPVGSGHMGSGAVGRVAVCGGRPVRRRVGSGRGCGVRWCGAVWRGAARRRARCAAWRGCGVGCGAGTPRRAWRAAGVVRRGPGGGGRCARTVRCGTVTEPSDPCRSEARPGADGIGRDAARWGRVGCGASKGEDSTRCRSDGSGTLRSVPVGYATICPGAVGYATFRSVGYAALRSFGIRHAYFMSTDIVGTH